MTLTEYENVLLREIELISEFIDLLGEELEIARIKHTDLAHKIKELNTKKTIALQELDNLRRYKRKLKSPK